MHLVSTAVGKMPLGSFFTAVWGSGDSACGPTSSHLLLLVCVLHFQEASRNRDWGFPEALPSRHTAVILCPPLANRLHLLAFFPSLLVTSKGPFRSSLYPIKYCFFPRAVTRFPLLSSPFPLSCSDAFCEEIPSPCQPLRSLALLTGRSRFSLALIPRDASRCRPASSRLATKFRQGGRGSGLKPGQPFRSPEWSWSVLQVALELEDAAEKPVVVKVTADSVLVRVTGSVTGPRLSEELLEFIGKVSPSRREEAGERKGAGILIRGKGKGGSYSTGSVNRVAHLTSLT